MAAARQPTGLSRSCTRIFATHLAKSLGLPLAQTDSGSQHERRGRSSPSLPDIDGGERPHQVIGNQRLGLLAVTLRNRSDDRREFLVGLLAYGRGRRLVGILAVEKDGAAVGQDALHDLDQE